MPGSKSRLPRLLGTRPSVVCGRLAEDPRWERSMLAPWRPFGQDQHLIVLLDITRPESEDVIGDAITGIVNDFPGVRLAEMTTEPF